MLRKNFIRQILSSFVPFTANVLYFLIQAFIQKAPTFPKAEKEDEVQEQEQQRKGKKERKGKGKICIPH